MAENEVPQVVEAEKIELVIESAPVAPLTRQELTAKVEELSARARAAGMSPLQTMLATYAKRGMVMIDTFLTALEDDNSTKKASATEAKAQDPAKREG